ncbi:hypothetical protein [Nocardia nepalensis]|uniref:hypothetical protein n=1 Tax=Nocardia nepalensis TaxID=3375448 RepID=UPI003B672775
MDPWSTVWRWLKVVILALVGCLVVFFLSFWLVERYLHWSRADALGIAALLVAIAAVPFGWLSNLATRRRTASEPTTSVQQTYGDNSPVQQTHGNNSPAVWSTTNYGPFYFVGPPPDGAARVSALEITREIIGEVVDAEPLTRAELSWFLWGKPGSAPDDTGIHRRRRAERLMAVNPDVRYHLDSALRLVPYCDWTARDLVGPKARRVGFVRAKIRVDVKIRNTGTESSGIRLKRPVEPVMHKYSLREAEHSLTYSILDMDETRKEVVPGTPVTVHASVEVKIWFDGWAKYDPFGYLRVTRDLAHCLCHPIDFVRVTGLLDNGQAVASDLLVTIPEQEQWFEIEPLDVDELKKHIDALDATIGHIDALVNTQVDSLNEIKALRAERPGELTDENRQLLATAAEHLALVATDLDHALGGPTDAQLRLRRRGHCTTSLPRARSATFARKSKNFWRFSRHPRSG